MDDIISAVKYTIEKGIPIPNKEVYPFNKMEIGDSFRFNIAEKNKIRYAMKKYIATHDIIEMIIIDDRLWRIK